MSAIENAAVRVSKSTLPISSRPVLPQDWQPPRIVLASGRKGSSRFRLPQRWNVEHIKPASLRQHHELAPITIIDPATGSRRFGLSWVAKVLAERQRISGTENLIVFSLSKAKSEKLEDRLKLLSYFPHPESVEVAENLDAAIQHVRTYMARRFLKEWLERTKPVSAPNQSALDHVHEIINATEDLREKNGKLSVKKVADLYGFSLREFAQLLGRIPQTLSKTPDADSLQDELGYFERIARLRSVLENDDAFRKWLRIANPNLGGDTPLKHLQAKRWQELADMVDDILTGSPA